MAHDPPVPTIIATYCLSSIEYEIGAAITPVWVGDDQSGAPVFASSAVNSPDPVP